MPCSHLLVKDGKATMQTKIFELIFQNSSLRSFSVFAKFLKDSPGCSIHYQTYTSHCKPTTAEDLSSFLVPSKRNAMRRIQLKYPEELSERERRFFFFGLENSSAPFPFASALHVDGWLLSG